MPAESAPDRFPRLLALLAYLADRGGAHVDELAYHFGVSPDRIRADLNLLWVAGLPGESPEDLIDFSFDDAETHVSLRQGLGLDRPLRLTPRETISLLLALRAIEGEVPAGPLATELKALIADLSATLPGASTAAPKDVGLLAALRDAVRTRRPVTFDYVTAVDDRSTRTVDPARVEERAGGWFLVGYCHDARAMRTFNLERIAALTAADAPWQTPAGAGAQNAARPDAVRVTLITDQSLRWLAERFDAPVREERDGALRMDIEFYSAERMIRTVLSVADRVRAVEPPDTARRIAERALGGLSQMDENGVE